MGAKGEPGPMGTPGVKVSGCWVLIEDKLRLELEGLQ